MAFTTGILCRKKTHPAPLSLILLKGNTISRLKTSAWKTTPPTNAKWAVLKLVIPSSRALCGSMCKVSRTSALTVWMGVMLEKQRSSLAMTDSSAWTTNGSAHIEKVTHSARPRLNTFLRSYIWDPNEAWSAGV